MRERLRLLASAGLALACIAVGVASLVQPAVQFTGVTLRHEGSEFIVDSVDPASRAAGQVSIGTRLIEINYTPVEEIDSKDLDLYLSGDFVQIAFEDAPDSRVELTFNTDAQSEAGFTFLVALGLLAGTAVWVARGLAGEVLRPLALPIATVTTAAMLLSPVWDVGRPLGVAAAIMLPAASALVAASGLLARITIARARQAAVLAAVIGTVLVPVALVYGLPTGGMPLGAMALLVNLANAFAIGLTLLTIAAIVVSTSRLDPAQATTYRSDRLPILLAAITPAVATASVAYVPLGFGLGMALVWLLGVVVVLQSNSRVETLRLQRDMVVAATEAERARLAADLHDDALQQMSMLARRLDDDGATAEAEVARSIAERVRDVCGDLRLPILDELGAGPALEWLVERVAQASGGEVKLARADTARPPADVELAVFRIAQEALSNAVNHGAPPIRVAYVADERRAELSVTDTGGGIPPDSAASAPRSGHYGLLNMRQRAEQIGAQIEFARGPQGGTAVGFRWSPA